MYLKAPDSVVNQSGLKVTPVLVNGGAPFGAEVEGVDWSQPICDALVSEVSKLQRTYRNQKANLEPYPS